MSLHNLRFKICTQCACTILKKYKNNIDIIFYNSAITKTVVCACIMVEMGSRLTIMVPVQSHNSFLDQRSRIVAWCYRTYFYTVREPHVHVRVWSNWRLRLHACHELKNELNKIPASDDEHQLFVLNQGMCLHTKYLYIYPGKPDAATFHDRSSV